MGIGGRADAIPKKINDRERRGRALTLRKAGKTNREIADTVICTACAHQPHAGVPVCSSPQCDCTTNVPGKLYANERNVRRAIQTALREITIVPAAELLQLELERLDTLQQAAWVPALTGNQEAFRNVLRTMERRAKYLGLDDFERRMAQLIEAQSKADENVVDQLQALMMAVLARLELPPDVQYVAPQIMAEELERLGYANEKEN